MKKINISLSDYKYYQECKKYKNDKHFKVIEQDDKFTAKEINKFYIPKVIAGIFISIVSLGLAPLCSKSIRGLFTRKVIVCTQDNSPKSMSNVRNVSKACLYQPENLFPDSQMPKDVINLVANFLDPKEIAGLKSVNKDWHGYVSENKSFEVIVPYIESMLKQVFIDGESNRSRDISDDIQREVAFITAVAQIDNEKARLLVTSMIHKDLALVCVEAKINLSVAIEAAEGIQDRNVKQKAMIELVKLAAQQDLDGLKKAVQGDDLSLDLKDEALLEIVKIEARKNIESAKESAGKIHYPSKRAAAFTEIVKLEAQIDVENAKETVEKIPNIWRYGAFIEIVKIEAQTDIEGAKKTALDIGDSGDISKALLEIVKVEAKQNIKNAKKTAENLEFYDKISALIEIAMAEAETDVDCAVKTMFKIDEACHTIHDDKALKMRSQVRAGIVKVVAQKNLKFAKEIAISNVLSDHQKFNEALIEIVKIEAQKDLKGAKKTAQKIDHEQSRDEALLEIVKIEAQIDFVEAQKTAGMISAIPEKIDAFIEILLVMGKNKQTTKSRLLRR